MATANDILAADVRRLLERIGVPGFRYRELRARERWEAAACARGMTCTPALGRADAVPVDVARVPGEARLDPGEDHVAIAVVSPASGLGTTTISATLASAIARAGWRCSAWDLDIRGELGRCLGLEPRLAAGGARSPVAWPALLPGGVVYVPFGWDWGDERLAVDGEVRVADAPARPSREVEKVVARSDEVVALLRPDDTAQEAVAGTRAFLARCGAEARGRTRVTYVVNGYDARIAPQREAWAALRAHLGPSVFPSPIQWDAAVREARASRRTIERLAPESQVVADVASLADWLLARHQRRLARGGPTREAAP